MLSITKELKTIYLYLYQLEDCIVPMTGCWISACMLHYAAWLLCHTTSHVTRGTLHGTHYMVHITRYMVHIARDMVHVKYHMMHVILYTLYLRREIHCRQ